MRELKAYFFCFLVFFASAQIPLIANCCKGGEEISCCVLDKMDKGGFRCAQPKEAKESAGKNQFCKCTFIASPAKQFLSQENKDIKNSLNPEFTITNTPFIPVRKIESNGINIREHLITHKIPAFISYRNFRL